MASLFWEAFGEEYGIGTPQYDQREERLSPIPQGGTFQMTLGELTVPWISEHCSAHSSGVHQVGEGQAGLFQQPQYWTSTGQLCKDK